jgi:hypothetical protein
VVDRRPSAGFFFTIESHVARVDRDGIESCRLFDAVRGKRRAERAKRLGRRRFCGHGVTARGVGVRTSRFRLRISKLAE